MIMKSAASRSTEQKRRLVIIWTTVIMLVIVGAWFLAWPTVWRRQLLTSTPGGDGSNVQLDQEWQEFKESFSLLKKQLPKIEEKSLSVGDSIGKNQELFKENFEKRLAAETDGLPTAEVKNQSLDEEVEQALLSNQLLKTLVNITSSPVVLTSSFNIDSWKNFQSTTLGFKVKYPGGWIWRQDLAQKNVTFINTDNAADKVTIKRLNNQNERELVEAEFLEAQEILINDLPALLVDENKIIINKNFYLDGQGEIFKAIALSFEEQ